MDDTMTTYEQEDWDDYDEFDYCPDCGMDFCVCTDDDEDFYYTDEDPDQFLTATPVWTWRDRLLRWFERVLFWTPRKRDEVPF